MTTEKKGDYGWTDDPLANGAKYNTGAIRSENNIRIKGTIAANQSGKIRIFQGPTEANPDDYVTIISFAAGVTPGSGEGWTVDCVGLFCRIEVENDSGVAMTIMRFGWKLTN